MNLRRLQTLERFGTLSDSLSGLYATLLCCSYASLVFTELVVAAPGLAGKEQRREEDGADGSFHLEEDTALLAFAYGGSVVFLIYALGFALGGKRVDRNETVERIGTNFYCSYSCSPYCCCCCSCCFCCSYCCCCCYFCCCCYICVRCFCCSCFSPSCYSFSCCCCSCCCCSYCCYFCS